MKKLLPFFYFSLLIFATTLAQKATLNFEMLDAVTQKNIPAKLVILQDGEPFEHGLSSTDDLACRGHTVYTRTGKGSIKLPVGAYEIWFGRGMEYSVDVQKVILDNRQSTHLTVTLKRELNPVGYIGGDMHLHTFTFSSHGDANVEERLISCVAEGLEWAVATDHNAVVDYTAYMKKLELEKYMATAVGNEVSTPIGHFNTYPLASGSEKVNSKISIGKELFEAIRGEGLPQTLIQINHPRWVDSDFFNTKGLDPFFGISKHPEWNWDFDAFEVLNENFGIGWRDAPDNKFSVKQDWFNMLNQGIRKTGLGNSDSHSVIAQIAGVPRNYIKSTTDDPTQINTKEIAKNIKNQQVSVARGLFVNMETTSGQGIGYQVNLEEEQQRLTLNLTVQAASWISCHKAELIENGVVIKTFDIPESTKVNRLEETITLQPKKDSWYLLIAYGDVPMAPMVQGTEKPVLPLGFTNPIWVDADGDDQITSLFAYSKALIKELNGQPTKLVEQLVADPAIVYPILYHLFTNKNEMTTRVAMEFLKKADTRQRQLLYRELSKEGSEFATKILRSQKPSFLNPLEEVALNYYTEFLLNQTKMERFKKEEASILDEQLNYLEDCYRFNFSGATEQWLKIAKANEIVKGQSQNWTEAAVPNNGIFPIGKLLTAEKGDYLFIDYPLYARMDTTITFYLNTNTNVRISRAGRILQSVSANRRFPIRAKLIKIKMKKGLNEFLFRLDNQEDAEISIREINPNKLLDPNLETTKTVEHLALDKKVAYDIEYAPKYHGHGIALTDGYRGTTDFTSQLWQGWNGENAAFVIDLGRETTINRVTIGTLIDQKSWIFSPASIECSFSTNGQSFSNLEKVAIEAIIEQKDAITNDVVLEIDLVKARYIKVVAHKIAGLPEWHTYKGSDAWIVLDEVMVE